MIPCPTNEWPLMMSLAEIHIWAHIYVWSPTVNTVIRGAKKAARAARPKTLWAKKCDATSCLSRTSSTTAKGREKASRRPLQKNNSHKVSICWQNTDNIFFVTHVCFDWQLSANGRVEMMLKDKTTTRKGSKKSGKIQNTTAASAE
jgi:hypothetical protein